MKVCSTRAKLLGALSALPRNLQRPPVAELIGAIERSKLPNPITLDINDDEIAQAVIAALVARELT